MITLNIIEDLKPHLIMLRFTELKPPAFSDHLYIFTNTEGWNLKFYPKANFVDVINMEDNFRKRLPLGKHTLQYIIKTIEDQDNDS